MIKALLMWLFKAQLAGILNEAKSILADAKASAKKEYVKYDPIEIGTASFLYGIQPLFGNKTFTAWLMAHKENCQKLMTEAMKSDRQDLVIRCFAQSTMIDSLLLDLERFEESYKAMLEAKKEAQK